MGSNNGRELMTLRKLLLLLLALAISPSASAFQATPDVLSILQPRENVSQVQEDLRISSSKVFGYNVTPYSEIEKILSEISLDDDEISALSAAYAEQKKENANLETKIGELSVSPEACELDELKHVQASEAVTATVRFNCIRQYILAKLPAAKNVVALGFGDATLSFHPAFQSFPTSTPQSVDVSIHNVSSQQIIAADIYVGPKNNSASYKIFRVYADFPIDPNTVGTLSGDLLVPINEGQSFGDIYQWGFISIWAADVE